MEMKQIFPLLYWLGLVVALVGMGLRFWLGRWELGLAVAVAGVALLLAGRLAQRLQKK